MSHERAMELAAIYAGEDNPRAELARALISSDARVRRLEEALRRLIRGYVLLLECGRDRIVDLGGQCDSLEQMEREDSWLREYRAALEPTP